MQHAVSNGTRIKKASETLIRTLEPLTHTKFLPTFEQLKAKSILIALRGGAFPFGYNTTETKRINDVMIDNRNKGKDKFDNGNDGTVVGRPTVQREVFKQELQTDGYQAFYKPQVVEIDSKKRDEIKKTLLMLYKDRQCICFSDEFSKFMQLFQTSDLEDRSVNGQNPKVKPITDQNFNDVQVTIGKLLRGWQKERMRNAVSTKNEWFGNADKEIQDIFTMLESKIQKGTKTEKIYGGYFSSTEKTVSYFVYDAVLEHPQELGKLFAAIDVIRTNSRKAVENTGYSYSFDQEGKETRLREILLNCTPETMEIDSIPRMLQTIIDLAKLVDKPGNRMDAAVERRLEGIKCNIGIFMKEEISVLRTGLGKYIENLEKAQAGAETEMNPVAAANLFGQDMAKTFWQFVIVQK